MQRACLEFLGTMTPADAAHDLSHVKRVVKNCAYLTDIEDANAFITVPAAWLHDCVAVAKDSPQRALGSRLAAAAAVDFLSGTHYPAEQLPDVYHAIEAHSYSADIKPRSLEAKVVQDADRLDSLGAIGIARCLLVGGHLRRPLFDLEDPFCDQREPDDSLYTIDHFYAKLFKLPATMQTAAGREEAHRRAELMQEYLENLRSEIA
ncbi:MAG: HD domain-containing protein [Xanthomonadales bacterium]|nr:HD domain-containing protein [Xanthomonadales bacterium]NNK51148.1 HD domain-containing protein [Xanthomonadales bacterium]